MSLGISRTTDLPFADAVARTREVLAGQGFGVLTEIDVTATLKTKLGEDMEPYLILGACNPGLAHRALGVDRELGLLLPCNVVVRKVDGATLVQAMDPQLMVTVVGDAELQAVADEARRLLVAALEAF